MLLLILRNIHTAACFYFFYTKHCFIDAYYNVFLGNYSGNEMHLLFAFNCIYIYVTCLLLANSSIDESR